jgi:hypothetical protein
MTESASKERIVAGKSTLSSVWPWVWRLLIAAAILAAPIITFWAFTDSETPDPANQQRLKEIREQNERGSNR